jgi:hypothetical protein
MNWNVYFSRNATKQADQIPEKVKFVLNVLVENLREKGPFPGEKWSNYGKLQGRKADIRHCHLVKGRPTYVCCWEVVDRLNKTIEVNYVGTHQKAPY